MAACSEELKLYLNTNAGIVLTLPSQAPTHRLTVHPPYKFPSLLPCLHILKGCLARNYTHLSTVNKLDLTSKHFAAMSFEMWTLIAFNSWWYPITNAFCDALKVPFLLEKPQGINKEWEFLTSCSPSKLRQLVHEVWCATFLQVKPGNWTTDCYNTACSPVIFLQRQGASASC